MLIKLNFLICFFLFFAKSLCSSNNLIVIKLFHKFDIDEKYNARGIITLKTTLDKKYIGRFKQLKPLTDNEIITLKKLSDKNKNYHIKAVALKDNESYYKESTTFIKACSLYTSNLSEKLVINLDQNSEFLSLYITTENPNCDIKKLNKVNQFNSTVFVTQTSIGPIPDTQTYIQRLEMEMQEKVLGESGDNRSFFAKYWIYILPISILLLISSATNPETSGN